MRGAVVHYIESRVALWSQSLWLLCCYLYGAKYTIECNLYCDSGLFIRLIQQLLVVLPFIVWINYINHTPIDGHNLSSFPQTLDIIMYLIFHTTFTSVLARLLFLFLFFLQMYFQRAHSVWNPSQFTDNPVAVQLQENMKYSILRSRAEGTNQLYLRSFKVGNRSLGAYSICLTSYLPTLWTWPCTYST